jgi:nitronate monooxygenase
VASFVFGVPSPEVMKALRDRSILTMGAATTVDEARQLDAAGLDLILASGSDAGGHRPSFLRRAEDSLVGTFSLVPQVVDAVKAPVIAAGGVSDARGVVAALALGASAAQLGTAFLACHESAASEAHKRALVTRDAERTTLTRAFSGRPARGVVNAFLEEAEASGAIAPFPAQNALTRPMRTAAAKAGDTGRLSLWAGQGVRLARRMKAAELVRALLSEVEDARRALQ